MTDGCSRRVFLALAPAIGAAQVKKQQPGPAPRRKTPLPRVGEFSRYLDAQTEQPVMRLTTLASSSWLPPSFNRITSSRERFLLFASDRDGDLAPYTMDLRTGVATQVADTGKLDLASLQLSASGRSVYFLDGGALTETGLQNRKSMILTEGVNAFSPLAAASDFVFVREGKLAYAARPSQVLLDEVANYCSVRPGQASCLTLRRGSTELWYVPVRERPVKLASGQIGDPCWSPGGKSVLFLRRQTTARGFEETVISEIVPEAGPGSEKVVASTSRYAAFAPNSDASVFVGASAGKAQPSILLLVRSVRREVTICEHRARVATSVNPSFSPDNRRVYFASDFQGRPAVYAVNVEFFVEPAAS